MNRFEKKKKSSFLSFGLFCARPTFWNAVNDVGFCLLMWLGFKELFIHLNNVQTYIYIYIYTYMYGRPAS